MYVYVCVHMLVCVCLSVLCVYMCSPYLFSTSLIQSNLYKTWSNLSIYLNRTVQSHYAYIRIIYTHSSIEHIYAIHTFAKHKYVYIYNSWQLPASALPSFRQPDIDGEDKCFVKVLRLPGEVDDIDTLRLSRCLLGSLEAGTWLLKWLGWE